jgi:hypothetical protein
METSGGETYVIGIYRQTAGNPPQVAGIAECGPHGPALRLQ